MRLGPGNARELSELELPAARSAARGGGIAAWVPGGLLKSAHAGPGVAAGVLAAVVVAAGLPGPARTMLLLTLTVLTLVLVAGAGEAVAVRVLFRARPLSSAGPDGLDRVMEDLGTLRLGLAVVDIYVGRSARCGAVGFGRRSVIVGRTFVADVRSGRVARADAVAALARAGFVVRSGMTRNDAAIMFWSTPWRAIVLTARPLAGVVAFAWRVRLLVFSVAICQTAAGAGASEGHVRGGGTAAALALLLLLTFAAPRAGATWTQRVRSTADAELARHGL